MKNGDGLVLTRDNTILLAEEGKLSIFDISSIDISDKKGAVLTLGRDFFLGNVTNSKAGKSVLASSPKLDVIFKETTSAKLTLKGKDYSALGNIKFTDEKQQLILQNDVSITSSITTKTWDTGIVTTMGNAQLGGSVGSEAAYINTLKMTGDANQKVTITSDVKDIYATQITQQNVALITEGDLTIHGNYTATDAKLVTGKTLTFAKEATFIGNNTITFLYNKDHSFGKIEGPINLADHAAISVNINIAEGVKIKEGTEVPFFIATGPGDLPEPVGWKLTDKKGVFAFGKLSEKTSKQEAVTESSEGESDTESSEDEAVTESSEGESDTESSEDESVTESSEGESDTESSEDESVTESSEDESVTESSEGESDTDSSGDESVTESSEGESVTESSEGESVTESSEDESVTESSEGESDTDSSEGEITGSSDTGEARSSGNEEIEDIKTEPVVLTELCQT